MHDNMALLLFVCEIRFNLRRLLTIRLKRDKLKAKIGKHKPWERRGVMKIEEIMRIVEEDFAKNYYNFKEFMLDEKYKVMWDMCVETVKNRDSLISIVFCNDVYQIPPTRVFVDINREALNKLRECDKDNIFFENGCLKAFVKQSVGAFWGMVFRFALGYEDKRTVSVVKEKNFGIQTASRFCMLEDKRRENLVID